MNGYKLQFWKWFNSVLLGYSPDGVEGFIDASNKSASPPSEESDAKSRRRLKKLGDNYERHNEDFICWNAYFFGNYDLSLVMTIIDPGKSLERRPLSGLLL